MNHVWNLQKYDEDLAQELSSQLNISEILARLMVLRSITGIEQAEDFLNPSLDKLTDPYCLHGMAQAVVRIRAAAELGQKIVIYGDYDVDGICSVVILKEALECLGAEVDYYIPSRFSEGYGLNDTAIEMLAEQGCRLLVTVDCGISASHEIELAGKLGMDVIVTDHHTPPPEQPSALAIINPRNDDLDQTRYLCGAGVAFKLACALLGQKLIETYYWLDLVALATVADVVPLIGENRILVRHGLRAMEKTTRPGLRELIYQNNLGEKTLTSWHIGYVLAPRINSAGRMASARISVELLTTKEKSLAGSIAAQLNGLNEERRQVEDSVYQEALEQIKSCHDWENEAILVIGGAGWHQGVIGIIASRLVEQFERPCIVISWEGDIGRGSARSTEDFPLYDALQQCADFLIEFGGHKMAAGLTISRKELDNFTLCMQKCARERMPVNNQVHKYEVDLEVQEQDINQKLYDDIQLLTPFGEGNPPPRFLLLAGEIKSPQWVGALKSHLKFRIRSANLDAIAFNSSDLAEKPLITCSQDMMFELTNNEFAGQQNLQLKIRALKSTYQGLNEFETGQQAEWLKNILEKIVIELRHHRPVVLIYPTFRSLVQSRAYMEYYLNTGSLQYLHGHLPKAERRRGEDKFRSGQGLVFITTQAYWSFYRANALLPVNLNYIAELWTFSDSLLNQDLPGHLNVDAWTPIDIRGRCQVADLTDTGCKQLIYVNQLTTLRNLERRFPEAIYDTKPMDIKLKRAIRHGFRQKAAGVLVCDGSLIPGSSVDQNITSLYLADSPFGLYELTAFAEYLLKSNPVALKIAFDQDSLERNWTYLGNLYPLPDKIQDIFAFCRQCFSQLQRYRGNDVNDYISRLSDRRYGRLEIGSALHVLADIGLCEPQKSGSIMATNFEIAQNLISMVAQHPFSLEGAAEKKALSDWQAALPDFFEG